MTVSPLPARCTPAPAKQPRRIAVVCSFTPSLVNFRFQLLRGMAEQGHRVVAFGPEDDRATVETLAGIGVGFERIPMSRAGLNPLADLHTLVHLTRRLRAGRFDTLLCYTMKPVIYGSIAGRLAGIKRRHALMTGLGYVFGDSGKDGRNALKLRAIRALAVRLYRIALRGDGRVFVYNEADANDIAGERMVEDLSRLIRVPGSGVDLERFKSVDLPDGGPVFLMVARLLRAKGVAEFAEAARIVGRRHPEARFELIGPLDPSPLAITRQEVDRWHAEGTLRYGGETRDVRPWLAASTVFVLPSYYREGIPRSILEAMATGRAIITADTPGCRDTVRDGENGFLVKPGDAAALALAMERFIAEPELAERMGRRSLEIVRQRFGVDRVNAILLGEMELL